MLVFVAGFAAAADDPQWDEQKGVWRHSLSSAFQAGANDVEVLLPDDYDAERRYRVLYVLPVEPGIGGRYGDGLQEIRKLGAHNRYDLICVTPAFAATPWYMDHADDPKQRHERHMLDAVVPLIDARYPTVATPEGRLLLGFSKSGWGAFTLLLRHRDVVGYAASWDAPLMLREPDWQNFGIARAAGTVENFRRYQPRRLLADNAEHFRGRRPRFALLGHKSFGPNGSPAYAGENAHTKAAHALMQSLDIPHVYDNHVRVPHTFSGGWVGPTVDALMAAAGQPERFDVVVVGGTPGGIMAAVAAARGGCSVVILDRNRHVGGLPANGLGATDIHTRGATAGLFMEFITRVKRHYIDTYGADSPQVRDCSDGYRFEPAVAERIFGEMLAEHRGRIAVRMLRQFDAVKENVVLRDGAVAEIAVTNRRRPTAAERYAGKVFIDATYEGDLAAAAGAPFRLGREGHDEYREPMAGRIYTGWGTTRLGPGSTGEADEAVQAYNYRLCLTKDPRIRVAIPKPDDYDREEFASLVDDIKLDRTTGPHRSEKDFDGIGRVVNMVALPNGKVDANNQHLAFLATDLPEENWPWPTADWAWRDRYAALLRSYTLGLLWFVQNDPALPEEFRRRASAWGLAGDEYTDNGHFPRQVYVREGRRIEGEHLFTAHDALAARGSVRPPVYADSITSSHYYLDSHACQKREPNRVHLDGFFSYPTKPYTVPYGVIVPNRVEGLLTPVPVSGTHVGFSTLRMEPCWMALGQAAGVAAALSVRTETPPRKLDVSTIQRELLRQRAMLIYFQDIAPGDPHYEAVQLFGLRGLLGGDAWKARLDEPVSAADATAWIRGASVERPSSYTPGTSTRGELLDALFQAVRERSTEPTS